MYVGLALSLWISHFLILLLPAIVSYTAKLCCLAHTSIWLLNFLVDFNKNLLAQGTLLNIMWQPGWEGGLGMNGCLCMYMAESLPCSRETIPALLIGYNPMQNKKFFKKEIFYWISLEKIIYLLFCEFCLVCHQCCYNVQFCKNNFFGLDFPFCFQICSFVCMFFVCLFVCSFVFSQ